MAVAEKMTGSRPPGRRAYLLMVLFAAALVLLPFLFWYDTWFGRMLTDRQVENYLIQPDKPRRTQQALVQIGERLSHGDRSVDRWYPKIIELSGSSNEELRQTAAWIMGQDRTHEPFHGALKQMLADESPMVRRNAALALAGFGDPAALPVLREMLEPSRVTAPANGALKYRLETGNYANPGTLLARVGDAEVRAALPGEVRTRLAEDGAEVRKGDPVIELSSDEQHVWEALRALYLVGTPEEAELVERYARGVAGMPDKIRQQAALTLKQLRARAAQRD